MADHGSESPVRIIGSRELHQSLPAILDELKRDEVRYVLTVHGKPRAVLVGAKSYLKLALDRNEDPTEAIVGLQLSALLGGTSEIALEELGKAFEPRAQHNNHPSNNHQSK
ncbi:MAG: type II toxin-antitoxin system Phd/YefM family antitoxin [Isosphaeraceae bacterium]